MVINLNKSEFDKLFDSDKNYLGDKDCILAFSAPSWCRPCQMMIPVFEKVSSDNDITIYEIDVDEENEISSLFNIRSVPTMYFVPVGGDFKTISKQIFMGAIPQNQVEKLLEKYF